MFNWWRKTCDKKATHYLLGIWAVFAIISAWAVVGVSTPLYGVGYEELQTISGDQFELGQPVTVDAVQKCSEGDRVVRVNISWIRVDKPDVPIQIGVDAVAYVPDGCRIAGPFENRMPSVVTPGWYYILGHEDAEGDWWEYTNPSTWRTKAFEVVDFPDEESIIE